MRTTGTAIGAQAAFAVIADAGLVGIYPAAAGFIRAFVMGAIGAGTTLIGAAFLPARGHSAPAHVGIESKPA
jgi:hypothetical protein